MKKILLLVGVILLMTACTGSLPGRFARLADKVEAKGADMSKEQWDKCNAKFEKLIQEYSDNYDSFNASQKKEISNAIARYCAAALKSGITNAAEIASGILSELPNTLNGLVEGAKGFLEGLGL